MLIPGIKELAFIGQKIKHGPYLEGMSQVCFVLTWAHEDRSQRVLDQLWRFCTQLAIMCKALHACVLLQRTHPELS